MLERILEPFGLNGPAWRFTIEGDACAADPKPALTWRWSSRNWRPMLPVRLAVERDAGRVRISAGDRARAVIGERPSAALAGERRTLVKRPERRGFGSRLIEGGLAQELQGEVRSASRPRGGLRIVMPLPSGNGAGMKPRATTPRVLLVEDEMLIACLLQVMLQDLGCAVVGPAARVDEVAGPDRGGDVRRGGAGHQPERRAQLCGGRHPGGARHPVRLLHRLRKRKRKPPRWLCRHSNAEEAVPAVGIGRGSDPPSAAR